MIKSYTAIITEVDDAEEAVRQIAEQTASAAILTNTIGIISAHAEFVSSGVYAAVAKALPFPTVGMTSVSHGAGNAVGTYILSILILTSDDCQFSCSLSDTIPNEANSDTITDIMRKCYNDACDKLPEMPKLALLYSPFFVHPLQSEYAAASLKIDEKIPVFGAVANDELTDSSSAQKGHRTFYCGENFEDRFAAVFISGNVNPKFYIASLTEEAVIMPRVGVITKADHNKLLEMNNMNATTFFRNLGFAEQDTGDHNKGLLSSILVMHVKDEHGDEVDILRIPFLIDDDGVYCGGRLVTGTALSIAFNTRDIVLQTAKQLTDDINKNHSGGGTALLYSCIGRRYGLLSEPLAELELMRDDLKNNFNYIAVYSSGEMYPMISAAGGKPNNLEFNQALIACVF
ncbi:MAG: FIST C-terminal domain-containing protein [Chitinispirillales bacterium]|nr:FIST C-terminal domain-containing protein [Chitinispirillales bacterium]